MTTVCSTQRGFDKAGLRTRVPSFQLGTVVPRHFQSEPWFRQAACQRRNVLIPTAAPAHLIYVGEEQYDVILEQELQDDDVVVPVTTENVEILIRSLQRAHVAAFPRRLPTSASETPAALRLLSPPQSGSAARRPKKKHKAKGRTRVPEKIGVVRPQVHATSIH